MIEPYIAESTLRVRYQETDQMRVVYHTNYLVWFEVGRTDYIRHFGYTYHQLEEMGLFLPVVDLQCRYLAPAHYDEEISVYTQIAELRASKISFSYEIKHSADQQPLAKGVTTHIWTNQEMKRVNLQRVHPDVYTKLQA
jgi:acyl-CoA thioester hydrolase